MKKIYIFIFCLLFISLNINAQSVAVSNDASTPDPSAMLDVKSATKGILIPRMDSTARKNISTPATGLLVFDTDTESYWFHGNTNWLELSKTSDQPFKIINTNIGEIIYSIDSLPVNISSVGGADNATQLTVHKEFTNTTGIANLLSIWRGTPGIPTDGIGGSILFRNQVSNKSYAPAALISAITLNANNLELNRSALKFQVYGTPSFNLPSNTMYFDNTGLKIGNETAASEALDVEGSVKLSGNMVRPTTGAANLVPICYGNVQLDGTINTAASTDNFTVTKEATGRYAITITGENYIFSTYTTMVTCNGASSPRITTTNSVSGKLRVYIFDINGAAIDNYFSFVVYKK